MRIQLLSLFKQKLRKVKTKRLMIPENKKRKQNYTFTNSLPIIRGDQHVSFYSSSCKMRTYINGVNY